MSNHLRVVLHVSYVRSGVLQGRRLLPSRVPAPPASASGRRAVGEALVAQCHCHGGLHQGATTSSTNMINNSCLYATFDGGELHDLPSLDDLAGCLSQVPLTMHKRAADNKSRAVLGPQHMRCAACSGRKAPLRSSPLHETLPFPMPQIPFTRFQDHFRVLRICIFCNDKEYGQRSVRRASYPRCKWCIMTTDFTN